MLNSVFTKTEQGIAVPKVSVVIPIYNTAPYLREMLNCIVNQTFNDIEIICIDDMSTDESWKIAKSYAESDNRFILQKNPRNMGAAVARNIGLQFSVGKYIAFLDSDDVYDLKFIEKMVDAIEKNNADMCICSHKAFRDLPKKVPEGTVSNISPRLKHGFNIRSVPEFIFQVGNMAPQFKLYRREFLLNNDINFQNLKNSNDVYFGILSLALAGNIAYVPEYLVYYRKSDSNTTSNRIFYQYENAKAYRKAYERLVALGIFDGCRKSFASRCMNSIIYQLEFVSESDRESFYEFWRNEGFPNIGMEACTSLDFLQDNQYDIYNKIMSSENEIKGSIKESSRKNNMEFKNNDIDNHRKNAMKCKKSRDVLQIPIEGKLANVEKFIKDGFVEDVMTSLKSVARIDIKFMGSGNRLIVSSFDEHAIVWEPEWIQKNGIGSVISSYAESMKFQLETLGEGELQIFLRGPYVLNLGGTPENLPYCIDYKSLKVDGVEALEGTCAVWNNKHWVLRKKVSGKNRFNVEVVWEPHE